MNKFPVVTLAVANYNHKGLLPNLLESVVRQSLRSLEVLIVDDGSKESCSDIVEAYRGRGLDLHLIEHISNRGLKETRLTGIENARGQILFFVDADDTLWGTDSLAHHVNIFFREQADVVHFNTLQQIPETGVQEISVWAMPLAASLSGESIFAAYLASRMRAHVLWNKLYSKELCLRCLPCARESEIHFAAEDAYLSTLLLFHARKYKGSEHVGYFHKFMPANVREQRSAEYVISSYRMLTQLASYLRQQACPPEQLTRLNDLLLQALFTNFLRPCHSLYQDNAVVPELQKFKDMLAGVDLEVFCQALHTGLYASQKRIEQLNGSLRAKDKALAKLKK